MNNLVYGNQDPAKLAASVEEIVRKDTGSATPLPYRLLDTPTGQRPQHPCSPTLATRSGQDR